MEKQKDKSMQQECSRMFNQLEKTGRESKDDAEKERLTRLVANLRNAIVSSFVKRPSNTDDATYKDEP